MKRNYKNYNRISIRSPITIENIRTYTNYFGDLVKKETGKSAQEYIHFKIMNLAKDRIHDKSKNINEIANELGFKYPQHFTRMFKKELGISPSEYRNQN